MKPKDIIAEYLRTALVDDGVINNVPQTVMAEGLLHALETRGFVVVPEAPADAMIIAGGGALLWQADNASEEIAKHLCRAVYTIPIDNPIPAPLLDSMTWRVAAAIRAAAGEEGK